MKKKRNCSCFSFYFCLFFGRIFRQILCTRNNVDSENLFIQYQTTDEYCSLFLFLSLSLSHFLCVQLSSTLNGYEVINTEMISMVNGKTHSYHKKFRWKTASCVGAGCNHFHTIEKCRRRCKFKWHYQNKPLWLICISKETHSDRVSVSWYFHSFAHSLRVSPSCNDAIPNLHSMMYADA